MSQMNASADPTVFKRLRKAARDGSISPADVSTLLSGANAPADQISRLRFALRLRRWVEERGGRWSLQEDLAREVAKVYRGEHARTQNPMLKFSYAQWAMRYGDTEFDWNILWEACSSVIDGAPNLRTKLTHLCQADLGIRFHLADGCIRATAPNIQPQVLRVEPLTQVASTLLYSRRASADAALECGPWSIALRTEEGLKPPNEDAALFALLEDQSYLVAIADGTGDSHDGARAAEVVLAALAEALAATGQMELAVELAAAAVRADNLERRQENACTLVAMHMTKDKATLVHLSDPFHWVHTDDIGAFWSQITKTERTNVGGEPFGYILTSSGNRVACFDSFSCRTAQIPKEVTATRCFVLGCDGLLPSATEASGDTCPVQVDFAGNRKSPFRVAATCCRLAREAMEAGLRGPDNITCITGHRHD